MYSLYFRLSKIVTNYWINAGYKQQKTSIDEEILLKWIW